MQLVLERIEKQVGAQTHLYPMDLALQPGEVTVLLGATQAGKTSLMRLMAGLDQPTRGRVQVDGLDVTGVPVRERNVAMVYQQFINYPSMTVFDNIASPLKLRGERKVTERVRALAAKLHIEPFLERYPAELSGGQQQRVALARALAKAAPLVLLDEPLVNLDYKPASDSVQLPPCATAMSTITEPGFIASTVSSWISTGALRPGISAVVMMMSACRARSCTSSPGGASSRRASAVHSRPRLRRSRAPRQ